MTQGPYTSSLLPVEPWKYLLKPSTSLSHFGITRYACISATANVINNRVKCARHTAYSLMGAGFHGISGVCNPCLKKILDTYILSRKMYGLKVLIISPKWKKMLEASFRQMLKRIQCFPQRTANEVRYILFGILPAEALLDSKTLIFFHNIITDHDSILY